MVWNSNVGNGSGKTRHRQRAFLPWDPTGSGFAGGAGGAEVRLDYRGTCPPSTRSSPGLTLDPASLYCTIHTGGLPLGYRSNTPGKRR